MRRATQPNGAYKLLVLLLYGRYAAVERRPRGITRISPMRPLARLLGSDTRHLRRWLRHLEDYGYIESLRRVDRRTTQFRIREPSLHVSAAVLSHD